MIGDQARESQFEQEICEYLQAHGWLYSPNSAGYDAARAIFPEDTLEALADVLRHFAMPAMDLIPNYGAFVSELLGGAVYGNAGAYGHSIQERVASVRYLERGCVREISNAACEFAYRESRFKRRKDWVILSVTLRLG